MKNNDYYQRLHQHEDRFSTKSPDVMAHLSQIVPLNLQHVNLRR